MDFVSDALVELSVHLVEVGERSASLGSMCLRAASLLEAETHVRVTRFVALANPATIIVLGALITPIIWVWSCDRPPLEWTPLMRS